MKAAVLYAPGDLRYIEVPVPENLGENEVLIKIRAAGICGSDLSRVMRTGTYSFPTIPGHEFCGEIEDMGCKVATFNRGGRVAVAPILPCFICDFCQKGNYGQCNNYNYLGSRTDGGFAQYVKAPVKNLVRLPDEVSFIEGATVEPAAVTLHGMKKAEVQPGDTVAVLGSGAIGLFAIQFAKILGATKVIAVDIDQEKLDFARTVGADICINSAEEDVHRRIRDITGNKGVNLAVETAGVGQTQLQCLSIVCKLGRILYLGTAHKDIVIPHEMFENIIRNEIRIVGAWNSYSAPFPGIEWHATIDYIKAGTLKVKPLITHTFPLENAPEVFKDLVERKYSFNKVVFTIN